MIYRSIIIGCVFCLGSISAFCHYSNQGFSSNVRPFIKNEGQWDSQIKFRLEIQNGYIFFRETGLTYLFYRPNPNRVAHGQPINQSYHYRAKSAHINTNNYHSVKLEFKKCDVSKSTLKGMGSGLEYFNYFKGSHKEGWVSGVKSFSEVHYRNIYPGISFKYYFDNGQLKYDIIIEKEANPAHVRIAYDGNDDIELVDGALIIRTSLQTISEQKPISFQVVGNKNVKVPSVFKMEGNEVGFEFPEGYDKSKQLVIDPKLVFSTFSGVTADNWGFTASFDSKGNTYSGGVASIQFGGNIIPPVGSFQQGYGGGDWDIAIFKYDSTGTNLLYGTYLGGNGTEVPHSLVLNSNDDLLVFGTTGSTDFPTSEHAISRNFNGGQPITPIPGIPYVLGSDLFVTCISENGTEIINSTYLGGSNNDGLSSLIEVSDPLIKNYGDQVRGDIITDGENNVYLATSTMSSDFPMANSLFPAFSGGIRDAILLKLNADLSQVSWGTYIGGSGDDAAFSVKLDGENNVLVAGATNSADFPVGTNGLNQNTMGGIDGFVNYFDKDGSNLMSGTFVGTPEDDLIYFSDFDSEGSIYILGQSGGNYPVSANVYSNPNSHQFIHKLSNNLQTSLFSTVFGSGIGSQDISPTAFLVNECDNLFIAGWGSSQSNFGVDAGYNGMNTFGLPVTANGFQKETNGHDFYLAVFTANMENLLYATYMGGTTAAPHVDGGTSRFDKRGVVYQSVCSCGGENDDFPTTEGTWSNTNNSTPAPGPNGTNSPRCNNAVFKFDLATIVAALETNTVEGDNPGIDEICLPAPILFTNESIGGEIIEWDFGDGTTSTKKDSIIHYYENAGTYSVVLRIEDQNTCRTVDHAYTTIQVFDYNVQIMDDTAICNGVSLQLSASGGSDYEWTLREGPTPLVGNEPMVKPEESITYFMKATTSDGCVVEDSVFVAVMPSYVLDFDIEKEYTCKGLPSLKLINKTNLEEGLTWDFGDGQTANVLDNIHSYDREGVYTIELSYDPGVCAPSKIATAKVEELFVPNAFSPNNDPFNEYFKIEGTDNMDLSVVNRWGKEVFRSEDYANDWNAEGLASGTYYYVLSLPGKEECKGWVQVFK